MQYVRVYRNILMLTQSEPLSGTKEPCHFCSLKIWPFYVYPIVAKEGTTSFAPYCKLVSLLIRVFDKIFSLHQIGSFQDIAEPI